MFAPLQDALERAHLEARDVEFCLPVGGGALIPQVTDAVEKFFHAAKILRFEDSEQIQTAVAHGAAWQALSLATHGKGLVHPIIGSSISIQAASGPVELIADGTELPYPAEEGWAECHRLVIPKTSCTDKVEIRVELRTGDRLLMRQKGKIRPPVHQGDPLRLRYRMDINQILHLRLDHGEGEAVQEVIELKVENPLTSVVNPNALRDKVLALEEKMRTKHLSVAKKRKTVEKIAELETELRRYERALSLLGSLNRTAPNTWILNRMGIIAGKLGDHEREVKFFREAARISSGWSGPLFNLSLSQERRGELQQAMDSIDEAIALQPKPPSMVQKASLAVKLKQPKKELDALLESAFAAFRPPSTLSDFELSWYRFGARLLGDDARQDAANREIRRRKTSTKTTSGGDLPLDRGEMKVKPQ